MTEPTQPHASTGAAETDPEIPKLRVSSSVSGRAARGAAWMGLSRIVTQGSSLVVFVILGRLLSPQAFGLVASASVVLWLLRVLVDQGFGYAIIQRPTLSREHVDTAFWTSLLTGLLLALVTFLAAPAIASAYSEPGLTAVLRVLSVIFIIAALDSTQSAILSRELRFREQALRLTGANIVSAVIAVVLALEGAGVWALVAQTLALEIVSVILLWSVADWRPSFRCSRACFNDLFGFGLKVMVTRVLVNVGQNADNFLIGIVLGPIALGYYVIAFRLMQVVNDLVATALFQVVLSAFSHLQDDRATLNAAFCRMTAVVALASLPTYGGLAIVAHPVIELLFGAKWTPSAPVLAALTLAGFVQGMMVFTSQYVTAIGKVGNELAWTSVVVAAEVAGFGATVSLGIFAVALSLGGVLLIAWPIRMLFLRSWGGVRLDVYAQPFPVLLACTGVMASCVLLAGWLGQGLPLLPRLAIEIVVGILTYGVSLLTFARGQAVALRSLVVQAAGRG